jgi:hypothetical protein
MRKVFSFLVLFALLVSVAPVAAKGGPADRGAGSQDRATYIVQMLDEPVVNYQGGKAGLKATKPNKGQKIDPNGPAVSAYKSYLNATHDEALNRAGGGRKVYSYGYTFNGFAAELDAAQAAQLAADPGVLAVTKDQMSKIDTISTPDFLGLTAPGGMWDMLGGVGSAGEGVIIGIVDSGIWPEHPSLSDRTGQNGNGTKGGKLDYKQIPGWHGKCTPGEEFNGSNCNKKLIGAQYFNEGFGGNEGVKAAFPYEYLSPRDADGHGTHTATTAGGNYNIAAEADGTYLGQVSGIAPRARISVYKVCWGRGDEGGCFNSDSVAAIDQAVADGVDVINFSISGSTTSFLDPVEVAFLYAADAGVFVAASAGNSGPGASTVAHNSPWLTTVAAGSHDRAYIAQATLGNGAVYTGVGLGAAVPATPLVLSDLAVAPGASAAEAALCFPGTLDPAVVAGKVVVCDRGVSARTEKSMVVRDAGGVGMILVNVSASSLNADLHYVPTVHLQNTDRAAIRAYAVTPGATAALSQGQKVAGAPAPDVASFSSRGPALAGAGNLLKPDIMAPGVDILAGVSPAGYGGRMFDFLSGTSMSSPHIAGIGALMKDAHPDWTPAMIKSALMTTATTRRNNGTPIGGNLFGYGAGQVVPNSAINPGLVYNAGWNDWLAFLCGTRELAAPYCPQIAIDPSSLNYPSIAVGALAGVKTVTRTVTNVGPAATYTVEVQAPAGVQVSVSPTSLALRRGESKSYSVTFTTQAGATLNAYTAGALTWKSGAYAVRSPIVLRPVALSAPGQVSGTGGPISYNVTFGFTGPFTAAPRGLVGAVTIDGSVEDDPAGTFSPTGPGVVAYGLTIPAGTTYARFSLFDANVTPGSDLDLYVFKGATQVGGSGSGTSNEEVNLVNPVAGSDYVVYVHGWQTAGGGTSNFTLFTWLLGATSEGNMTVSAPAAATIGGQGAIDLTFSGLTPGVKYLGSVAYSGSTGLPNPTIVRVDP